MRSPRHLLRLKNGVSISAPPQDRTVAILREVWIDRCYAPRTDQINHLERGVVVDIGAHVGIFTRWIKSHWPSTQVISLEPSHQMFSFLNKNIRDNALQNVIPIEVGCGGASCIRSLYSRGSESGNTMYTKDNYGSKFILTQRAQVWSLNDLFAKMNIQNCQLLKLDCEGAEYEILFNATEETLSKVHCISMEYHVGLSEYGPAELERFLEMRGFTVITLPMTDVEEGYMYAYKIGQNALR